MTHVGRRAFLRDAAPLAPTGTAPLAIPGFPNGREARPASGGGGLPDNPFLSWFGIDEPVISKVMSELTHRGADAADIYFQHRRANWIMMEDGIISQAYSSIDQGAGMRVVVGEQTGYSYTEDLTLESMLGAARTAAAIAKTGGAVPPVSYELQPFGGYYTIPVPWEEVGIDRKLPRLRQVETLARKADSRVDKVGIYWNDEDERVLMANLSGRIIVDRRPMTILSCSVTARQGKNVVTGSSSMAGRRGIDWHDETRLRKLAKQAVDRTVVQFDARRPPAGEMPVVLMAGASGILLHEAIGHGMEADFNRKGVSIFSNMLGKKVAPEFVTIVDDGTVPNERGALNYDDEGEPCEKTVLVKNGILTSYLHDGISSRHYKAKVTGSGRRQSFRHAPIPRMRCTYMEDGPHSREEIIASVERGIAAETFTNGQVEIGAGDFTFYIKNGWLIENGKLTVPIKDANIIGNGPDVLRKVTMAANDAVLDTGGWTCGKNGQMVPVSQGLPTLLVSAITVGGDNA